MRIFMTGGTGFVGKVLTRALTQRGHKVTVLTRAAGAHPPLPGGASYLEGISTRPGAWQGRVGEHEAVINLAGASIFRRWTAAAREAIRESRILTTRNLAHALDASKAPEKIFLSASAVGYYGFQEDGVLDEESPAGEDFLASVTREWEGAALEARERGARVVLLRFGIVLGRGGGALARMLPLFRRSLGSPLGSGQQWFSWIHEEDLTEIFSFLLERRDISGPVNCTAPHPVRNAELTRTLGRVLGRPPWLPAVPGFLIRMITGAFGETLLRGQRVRPKKLTESGFHFRFPRIEAALRDLLGPDPSCATGPRPAAHGGSCGD